MNGQRTPSSSVTPQTQAATGQTMANLKAREDAALAREQMQTQQTMQQMQLSDNEEARKAALHQMTLQEKAASQRQVNEQMGWDKQRAHDAKMQQSRLDASKAEKVLDARVKSIREAQLGNFGSQMANMKSAGFKRSGDNPAPIGTAFGEAMVEWNANERAWQHNNLVTRGNLEGQLATASANLLGGDGKGGSKRRLENNMLDQIVLLQKNLLGIDDRRGALMDANTKFTQGIFNTRGISSIFTNPDPKKLGFWDEAFKALEGASNIGGFLNPAGAVSALIPIGSHDIVTRYGVSSSDYALYKELFGSDGVARGRLESFMSSVMTGNLSEEAKVATYISNRVGELRTEQRGEVSKRLKGQFSEEELSEVLSTMGAYEETTLNQEGLSKSDFVNGLTLKVKAQLGGEVNDEEQAIISQFDGMAKNAGQNPFTDPESLSKMSWGWSADGFSVDPVYGDNAAASVVDSRTALIRYTQHMLNQFNRSAQFGDQGKKVLPIIHKIIDFIDAGQPSDGLEPLGKELLEISMGESGTDAVFIDDFIDGWGSENQPDLAGPDGTIVSQGDAFIAAMTANGSGFNDKLTGEIFSTFDGMAELKGIIANIWNRSTGFDKSTDDPQVITGKRDHLLSTIQAEQMSSARNSFSGGAGGKQFDTGTYSQEVMNKLWSRLMDPKFNNVPIEVKEAIHRELGRTQDQKNKQVEGYNQFRGDLESLSGLIGETDQWVTQTDLEEGQLYNELDQINLDELGRQTNLNAQKQAEINALIDAYSAS
jgi:hypothetical protein